jgi:hypothetical protein
MGRVWPGSHRPRWVWNLRTGPFRGALASALASVRSVGGGARASSTRPAQCHDHLPLFFSLRPFSFGDDLHALPPSVAKPEAQAACHATPWARVTREGRRACKTVRRRARFCTPRTPRVLRTNRSPRAREPREEGGGNANPHRSRGRGKVRTMGIKKIGRRSRLLRDLPARCR